MRKPAFCIWENKDADQLRGNREADQCLCFCYMDSTIPLFLNLKIQASSHLLLLHSPVCVRPGRKPKGPVFSCQGSADLCLPCLPRPSLLYYVGPDNLDPLILDMVVLFSLIERQPVFGVSDKV